MAAHDSSVSSQPTAHRREVFYVGGEYVSDDTGTQSLRGQMYVEKLIPDIVDGREIQHTPIIFIHGATRSGVDWITTPDGRPGWTSFFLSKGYECYVVDLPFRGRSPWHPGHGNMISHPPGPIQKMCTASREYSREGDGGNGSGRPLWPHASLHTQWPGSGVAGDPVFDNFYAGGLQILDDVALQEKASQDACAALLDRIGGDSKRRSILVGHSAGGPVPYLAADVRPELVALIAALEPAGPPFRKIGIKPGPGNAYGVSNAPITYEPPVADPKVDLLKTLTKPPKGATGPIDCMLQSDDVPSGPKKLVNLVDVPVLIVTAEASYHAQYDWAALEYLKQAGVRTVEHLKLGEADIRGNGHMMFLEKNSDEVAAELLRWFERMRKPSE